MSDDRDETPAWLRPHGRGWRSGPPETQLDNPWFQIERYEAEAPTGAPTPYHVVRFKNRSVGVLPLFDDGTVMLVGQWRFPFADYFWEMPEGGVPAAEDLLAGAQRELREEAGLLAAEWRKVLTLSASNASTDEVCTCFIAWGLEPTATQPDATEALTLARVPFREALEAACAGRITDMMTVATLLRTHHMAVSGRLPEPLARAALGHSPPSAL